ncbi:hypothetical protein BJX64DRAFT_272658 [Aspergillus heterothallicus]
MLRPKPTHIALTEDDVCYHLEGIFKRNNQLTKWHRQGAGSGSSYDGDDDDGLFLDSDTLSLPETLFESDCDDTRSQDLADTDTQENRTTGGYGDGSRVNNSNTDTGQLSQAVVRVERHPMKDELTLPWGPLIGLPPNTDKKLLSGLFTQQQHIHLSPHSLSCQPFTIHPQNYVRLKTTFERVFLLETAVSLQILLKEGPSQEGSHRLFFPLSAQDYPPVIKLFQCTPSESFKIKFTSWRASQPATKMSHTNFEDLASKGQNPLVLEPNEVNALVEVTHGELGQPSLSRSMDSRSTGGQTNTPGEPIDSQFKSKKKGAGGGGAKVVASLSPENTISRGTQTDSGLVKHMYTASGTASNQPQEQENIAPTRANRPSPQQSWQDPFISAMFPEPTAPPYDPADQARRGMRGIPNPPTRRGRGARTQQASTSNLVHPTMIAATVFQEYVHELIAELDRAP